MTPTYHDSWLTIYGGDVRDVLPELAADSVDCIVTSPPYWGLRDYGTASWAGGDTECDHSQMPLVSDKSTLAGYTSENIKLRTNGVPFKGSCGKCGAVRQDSQLGLERTPEEYVTNMVAVFRELRRVLKPSGTCWLNLGDSYAGSWGAQSRDNEQGRSESSVVVGPTGALVQPTAPPTLSATQIAAAPKRTQTGSWVNGRSDLKPKDLVGIPWRVAFALQADGWYLRSDIIWSKPNPMPESVTDRPTKSHEYLFLLTKSARYYFDADAVREPEKPWNGGRINAPKFGPERMAGAGAAGTTSKTFDVVKGANIRSVWTIATRPYPGAHFAVFPPELPERCIKAGSPEHGVVLDPFAGSGTTGMVANRLSRRAILIDLNPEYLRQQMQRNAQTPLGLTEGDAA